MTEKIDDRNYSNMTSYTIGGIKAYDFNKETGILQMSISPDDLEIFMEGMNIPPEGKDLKMPLIIPEEFGTFRGVKKVESIPGKENWEYLFKMVRKK